MDYEKNIEQLKNIIENLENEKLPLDEAIKLYGNAESLCKECTEYLQKSKGQIYKIKQNLTSFDEEKMK